MLKNLAVISTSIVNMIGGIYAITYRENKNLHFNNEKDIVHTTSSKYYEAKWLWARFGSANHLLLIAWFISYGRWVSREKVII